jgi:hypothetical protein
MGKRNIFLFVFVVVFSAGSILRAAENVQNQDRNIIRRYAVVMGANDGGKDRVRLRYAVSDARAIQVQKETLIKKSHVLFFGELNSKTMSSDKSTSLLLGAGAGLTFGNVFSVGVAGYGKSNFAGGGPGLPGYGGFTFAYVFNPDKAFHWRITSLIGSGSASGTGVFYIFEPGAEIILNISRIFRIQAGISIPITDRENNSGFNSPVLNVGFQFGK